MLFPSGFATPTPGSMPCFLLCEGNASSPPRVGKRPLWTRRCSEILQESAADYTNAEIAEFIAVETGMRFKEKTISERRSDLGFESPRRNVWTAPLRRWKPWKTS